ncbi:benzoate-CoA ligase family protein [Sulfobacillus thermosulfidooxidans]|uniref:benzoate-CoA ligase family protein n=1 Tax=Sulfobacillus thermosulfidooxidans TaxID=28034 RepID=UPI00040DD8D0|nr:benzoate-CoA ligase family protein [Sulfobacillus thermosulfidooxidans]
MPVTSTDTYNVTDEVFRKVKEEGWLDRPALYFRDSVWTYAQLLRCINQVANGLETLGIEEENRIVIISYDSPYFLSIMYGAMKRGAVPIPLNTNLPAEDYLYYLMDSRAKILAVEQDIWNKLAPLLNNVPLALKWVLILPSSTQSSNVNAEGFGGPILFYQDWLARQSESSRSTRTRYDDPAFWLYSSGSTGRPKAAVHLQKDMMVCNTLYAQGILHITEEDRLFSASKLFFAYGLGNGSYFAFANGASVVLEPDKPEPLRIFQDLVRYRPTLFFGVPTLYNAMLRHPASGQFDLQFLRACVSAGEPLPQEIYIRWQQRYGVEILDGIGSTEVLHIYISNRLGESKPGTTGQVVPGYEVRILDADMNPVTPGTMGDLYVKGNSIAPYYWGQYHKTRMSMIGEWFKTGDKYFQDTDGNFVYCGRSDDMIKAGGIWVSPIEVENVLLEHPSVVEAAVIGQADADGLEKPVAFVVIQPGIDPSPELTTELQQYVKLHLAHYKYPRQIHFVSELPKTASGKIQRFRLREGSLLS